MFPEHNYKSIYCQGKTLRMTYDPSKPIGDLDYPEFYDVKITNACEGKCPYCYQGSMPGEHYENVVEKIRGFFGCMTDNQKPYQLAIGGGEPTSHPEFCELLKVTRELGIAPNYTTNGMFIRDAKTRERIIESTVNYCEGVALSCHPHLWQYWTDAAHIYHKNGVFTNFHNIISDTESVITFIDIYKKFESIINYFVLLPLKNKGRSNQSMDKNTFDFLISTMRSEGVNIRKIAFGANFFPFIQDAEMDDFKLSLYEPEIMSKFLDLNDMSIHASSFAETIR
jgi:organic radical activating enzyme